MCQRHFIWWQFAHFSQWVYKQSTHVLSIAFTDGQIHFRLSKRSGSIPRLSASEGPSGNSGSTGSRRTASSPPKDSTGSWKKCTADLLVREAAATVSKKSTLHQGSLTFPPIPPSWSSDHFDSNLWMLTTGWKFTKLLTKLTPQNTARNALGPMLQNKYCSNLLLF
jgi:hypothetical protein